MVPLVDVFGGGGGQVVCFLSPHIKAFMVWSCLGYNTRCSEIGFSGYSGYNGLLMTWIQCMVQWYRIQWGWVQDPSDTLQWDENSCGTVYDRYSSVKRDRIQRDWVHDTFMCVHTYGGYLHTLSKLLISSLVTGCCFGENAIVVLTSILFSWCWCTPSVW